MEAVPGCIEGRSKDLRVGGERVAGDARAREEREADAATGELLAENLDRALCGVQPVGPDITHRHALRNVERDDRVDGGDRAASRHLSDLRADERDHGEKARATDEDDLRELSSRARRRKARAAAGERRERATPPDQRDDAERDDEDRRDHERRKLRVGERSLHGVLRNTVAASASSTKRTAIPSARKLMCAS